MSRREYGCGDNSCIFGPPGGMGTNGGCRCWQDMPPLGEIPTIYHDGIRGMRLNINKGVQAQFKETARLRSLISRMVPHLGHTDRCHLANHFDTKAWCTCGLAAIRAEAEGKP